MSADSYHKRKLGNRVLQPETQMMGYGFDPAFSEGSLKPPIFLTSTFVFRNAQDGKDFFDYTSGRRAAAARARPRAWCIRASTIRISKCSRIGSRSGRAARAACVFSSGMSAISTTLWAYLKPNDCAAHEPAAVRRHRDAHRQAPCRPSASARCAVPDAINRDAVMAGAKAAVEKAKAKGGKVGLLVTETPANPTNGLVDLKLWREASEWIAGQQGGSRPPVAVDNTFLGPVFQKPLEHGADLVMYSLTKYVGGHSDLVAGGVVGPKAMVAPVRSLRSSLGTQLDPNTSWMIMRSMETLALRMRASVGQRRRASRDYLAQHPKVASVNYLGHLKRGDPRAEVFERQCQSAGSTFAFSIRGGEAEAFRMLDALQVMKLAVSLGGTETLISHPGLDHAFGRAQGNARPARHHRRDDPHLRGHRERRRPDRGPGAGARRI